MNPVFRKIVEEIGNKNLPLSGKSAPFAIAGKILNEEKGNIFLTLTENLARELSEKTETILGKKDKVVFFPNLIDDVYGSLPPHFSNVLKRANGLSKILFAKNCSLILSPMALLVKVPKRGFYERYHPVFEKGRSYSLQDLKVTLWEMGYKKVELVEGVGEYSIRGSLMDIFPPEMDFGLRVEFFGDEIEEIRFFDPLNQRSLSSTEESFTISPLTEVIRNDELISSLKKELQNGKEFGEIRLEQLLTGGFYKTMEVEARFDKNFFYSLPQFMELESITPLTGGMKEFVSGLRDELNEQFEKSSRPSFLEPKNIFSEPAFIEEKFKQEVGESRDSVEQLSLIPSRISENISLLRSRVKDGFRVVFAMNSEGTSHRVREIFSKEGEISLFSSEFSKDFQKGFYFLVAPKIDSLIFPEERWIIVSENDFLGKVSYEVEKTVRKREIFFEGLRDLKVGDFVVHSEHGIGIYKGIQTIKRGEVEEDFLFIEYANNDKLLLPMERMDLIEKYKGSEGFKPPLDKLGTLSFQRRKDRVKKATKDIAEELLKIYAKRKTSAGVPLFRDETLEEDFAKSFPYELTPDQKKTLEEVYKDLESSTPADRVICGDVGFGKTEIAMRAAFRVANSGRQVAILCPTTVLALQHYETFKERFSLFPISVEMLSRFVPKKEQKGIVDRLKSNEVNILIGTHRILSKDVEFSNLGLLIIDEEQRFGVLHKEKIKKKHPDVHILTLSATPIPRTLQMGLSTILDMSLIETPPKDRLSIDTTLSFYDEGIIKSAIKNELKRGGQVFYLYNRVEDIESKANKLKSIIDEGKIIIVHGRLEERELERRMLDFYHHKGDILLTTTIIENGVDIPSANTLIVENAHKFGLSQLYQIRGRIGRSNTPAYAHLLIPKRGEISKDALEKLRTLEEFSELGSGFRVAAIDLELRGAGNLLGKEQSGNIDSIGFDLYMRLLEESVMELKGIERKEPFRSELLLRTDVSIPKSYIENDDTRLSIYRELSVAKDEKEVEQVKSEMVDRFGNPPENVENLIDATKLKLLLENLFIERVQESENSVIISFGENSDIESVLRLISKRKGVRMDGNYKLVVPLEKKERALHFLKSLFSKVKIGGKN